MIRMRGGRARLGPWESRSFPEFVRTELSRTEFDVCVIGAGIAGLTTAYLLCREGYSVAVLDHAPIAGGETRRSTAHLSNAIDDRYLEIERLHGPRGSRLAAESHTAAIDSIEEIVHAERIDCDFERVDGYLFPGNQSRDLLEHEFQAARRAGLLAVAIEDPSPRGTLDRGPCLRFPGQGQVDPCRYMTGLAKAIIRDGGQIAAGAHAGKIESGPPPRVHLDQGPTITAGSVVVATNSPVNDLFVIHTKQAPYTTYALAALVPRGSVLRALCWDMEEPYHYVRLANSPDRVKSASLRNSDQFDLLIVGGEDHKAAQAEDADQRHGRLEDWARRRYPMMGEVTHRWSGQVMETIDGLAFIGHNPLDQPQIYVATGDSGMGMTHGTIAGILLRDQIAGRQNDWEELYDPRRKSIRALPTFLAENANVAAQYLDWAAPADVNSPADVAAGRGGVLRDGLRRVAVYRDEDGTCHSFSAACSHLGCIVGWNPTDRTWDCPCHGSRFDPYGKVIHGPANLDLAANVRGNAINRSS